LDRRLEFISRWKYLELRSPSLIHLDLAFCLNNDSCVWVASHNSCWSYFLSTRSLSSNCLSADTSSNLFSSSSICWHPKMIFCSTPLSLSHRLWEKREKLLNKRVLYCTLETSVLKGPYLFIKRITLLTNWLFTPSYHRNNKLFRYKLDYSNQLCSYGYRP